jgi:hypothetical protein
VSGCQRANVVDSVAVKSSSFNTSQTLALATFSLLSHRQAAAWLCTGFWQHPKRSDAKRGEGFSINDFCLRNILAATIAALSLLFRLHSVPAIAAQAMLQALP